MADKEHYDDVRSLREENDQLKKAQEFEIRRHLESSNKLVIDNQQLRDLLGKAYWKLEPTDPLRIEIGKTLERKS